MLGEDCWFCDKSDTGEPLRFDFEFDTPVHESCIRQKLEADPEHPEAQLMSYLLEPKERPTNMTNDSSNANALSEREELTDSQKLNMLYTIGHYHDPAPLNQLEKSVVRWAYEQMQKAESPARPEGEDLEDYFQVRMERQTYEFTTYAKAWWFAHDHSELMPQIYHVRKITKPVTLTPKKGPRHE